jgi:hypothetical protein
MTVADLRASIERAVAELPVADLPDLVGALAAASARAELRLRTPAPTPTTKEESSLVSVEEVAQRCGLSVYWLREQANAGRIPVTRAGRRMLFDPTVTIAAIKALATKAKRRKDGRQDKRSWGHRRQKRRDSQHVAAGKDAIATANGQEVSTAVAVPAPLGGGC